MTWLEGFLIFLLANKAIQMTGVLMGGALVIFFVLLIIIGIYNAYLVPRGWPKL